MTDSITPVIEPIVNELGFDLEAVEVKGSGAHRVLTVAIDADAGVGIEDIAEVTRTISPVLDVSDAAPQGAYTLEVTSRGVDRPLTEPRHWRRNRDRLVAVVLTDTERFEARIGDSDADGVDLVVQGVATRFPYQDIVTATVQIELNRKDV